MGWRRVSLAALLSAAACAPAAAAPVRPAVVVVVAGQSNALGYGLDASALPPAFRRPPPGVKIWDGARFAPLVPGRNTGSPKNPHSWGPEVGFADDWVAAHPGHALYIVKYARGSTALAAGPGPDWAPDSGELFSVTQAEIAYAETALRRRGLAPRIAAVLWMQGEADAADPRKAALYQPNLAHLIAAIRSHWAQPATPVVVGMIPKAGAFADQVRQAQAAVDAADPRVVSVDAAALPLQADGLHLSGVGQARLGVEMRRASDSLRDQHE